MTFIILKSTMLYRNSHMDDLQRIYIKICVETLCVI